MANTIIFYIYNFMQISIMVFQWSEIGKESEYPTV